MRTFISLAALILAGWFGGEALAQPSKAVRTVQDDVGMFSADAKAKANAEIARIKQAHKKDLFIEAAHAPTRPDTIKKDDKAAIAKFFDRWAADKFKNAQINGVYVVIVPEATIIRVVVGPKTLETGLFTNSNRDELFHKLQEKLKAGDKDGALLAAAGYVADAMQRNGRAAISAAPTARAQKPQPGAPQPAPAVQPTPIITWVLIGLGILLAFWVISAIFRGLSSMGGGGGAGYGPGYGGGGGGFMTGFLGGMFGAAAGMWAYNHFFGGGGPSAYAGGSPSSGNPTSEPTDVGAGEPSVGGGDYGDADQGAIDAPDDAGGGDWGGGDAGGGDWGGGDAGGGGDWGGGGGGDW